MNKKQLATLFVNLALTVALSGLLFSSHSAKAAPSIALPAATAESSLLYLPLVMKNFQPAWVTGKVSEQGSGTALAGARVCSQNGECAESDTQGNYRIYLSAGWKQLSAQKDGYVTATQSLNVLPLETRVADFALLPSGSFVSAGFKGTVRDAKTNALLSGVTVCNQLNQCASTGLDGTYTLSVNALGQFELKAEKAEYISLTKSATAVNGQFVTVDFALSKQWPGAWIEGTVIDASRGKNEEKALAGVRLCTQFNECATSNSTGYYKITLTSADWREVTAQKDGFYTTAKGIQPQEGQTVTLNFVLSPYLSGIVARIVVTWDATPTFTLSGFPDPIENDLDAYLYIEHEIGNRVIYFGSNGEYLSSRLLYDVRKGSGPETIDIVRLEPSPKPTRYFYGVHHANYVYSGQKIPTLNQLGAQVCLYTTIGQVARCYTAPPGDQEFWFVFEMDQQGNLLGRDCLVNDVPRIDWERPDGTPEDPDDKGNPVVGISFPTCP